METVAFFATPDDKRDEENRDDHSQEIDEMYDQLFDDDTALDPIISSIEIIEGS